jgi:hypothetical protein
MDCQHSIEGHCYQYNLHQQLPGYVVESEGTILTKKWTKASQLQKSISSLSQDNMSVSSHTLLVSNLFVMNLVTIKPFLHLLVFLRAACGSLKFVHTFFDQQYVFQFLMRLNKSFSHIKGQILLMDPLPPINKVFSLVVQEKSQ